jgi:uncharacterized protein
MHELQDTPRIDLSRIAQDLQVRKVHVEAVAQLLDEGNTVPFITRYRKERTGGLDELMIRAIQGKLNQAHHLTERKQTILKSVEAQGKLTEELRAAILAAETPKRLEDLYLPYKPKKPSLATAARDKGLGPLAEAIWNREPAVANLAEVLPTLINPEKGLNTPEEVLQGVGHIIAELIAETADVRAVVRFVLWDTGKLTTSKNEKVKEGEGLDFKDYFQFTEPVRHIPPHRTLAINRGERANALQVKLEFDPEALKFAVFVGSEDRPPALAFGDHPHAEFLRTVADDALGRLLIPSLEREIRRELTTKAQEHAVDVFARNLCSLLLAPPLRDRRVLAIDPAFRTGCKLAALDDTGNLLEDGVIYPHQPQNKKRQAKHRLEELIRRHRVQVIAIGNGTACRETEELVSDLIEEFDRRRRGDAPPATPAPDTLAVTQTPTAVPAAPLAAAEVPATPAPDTPVMSAPAHSPAPAEPPLPPAVPPAETPTLSADTPTLEAGTPAASAPSGDIAAAPTEAPPPPAVVAAAPPPEPPAPLPDLSSLPEPLTELAYIIVNEAGASVYSASAVGREEFPDFDATLRGTISIGRRLQDPLSELVKIDPQNIGVGLYQHDVSPKHLKESLEGVIESSVNRVGVDLNTASVPLLRHVSGLNQLAARELVDYRKQNGPFRNREQLINVPSIGPVRFIQAAGFLKIVGGENPLDRTWIHPESYAIARQLLIDLGYGPEVLEQKEKNAELQEKLKSVAPEEVAARLQIGVPTLCDILEALARPGRDPREDLPPPIFRKGILKLEDLQPGMELRGTVLNVVDFGAFMDIGLKDSGLVHISQMANRYIKSPYEVVSVGDAVDVWVLTVDNDRRRVSLTMIKPGTPRHPPERRDRPARPQRGEHREQGEQQPQQGDRGQRPQHGGPPPRGRHQGPPPRRGQGRPPYRGAAPQQQPGADQPAGAQAQQGQGAAPQQGAPRHPPPPQRRPRRQAPPPKLTQDALQGKAPLHTFAELNAFFVAKRTEPKVEPAPEPEPVAAEAEPSPPAP